PMCDVCIWIAHHEAGRLCDRCIHRLNTQHPGVRLAVGNQHPLAHSHVLDTCVDRAGGRRNPFITVMATTRPP
ncbi:MAG TPA: hypothetical protein VGJ13_10225, partial [Pseudonocardiaceae bacterium]